MSDADMANAKRAQEVVDFLEMVNGEAFDASHRAVALQAAMRGITTARSEGFAAGEASMRERAAEVAQEYDGDEYSGTAALIRALPPSSPAVWTAESLANGERDG